MKMKEVAIVMCVVLGGAQALPQLTQSSLQLSINTTWNGQKVGHAPVTLELAPQSQEEFAIIIQAPYFDGPSPPEGTCKQGYPYHQLYNYEVVEIFFLASESVEYVELEFSPCGAHLILLLHPTRTDLVQYLPLSYTASLDQLTGMWRGEAVVPASYLPQNVDSLNAFAIHSATPEEEAGGLAWTDGNVYESLYPVPNGPQPDFHNLEVFEDFEAGQLGLDLGEASTIWEAAKQAKLYYKMETTIRGTKSQRPLEVTFERDDVRGRVTITARQTKGEADLVLPTTCDSLMGSDDRHDNSPGTQIYFFSQDDDLNLQVILGYSAQEENMTHVSEFGFPSECTSVSFLQGAFNLLDRRVGSNEEDVIYTENYLWINGNQIWEGVLELSRAYLPPNIKTIQIVNNDNHVSPEVDLEDLTLFRLDSSNPMHRAEAAGLVYSSLVVEEEYNSQMSSIWADILGKEVMDGEELVE